MLLTASKGLKDRWVTGHRGLPTHIDNWDKHKRWAVHVPVRTCMTHSIPVLYMDKSQDRTDSKWYGISLLWLDLCWSELLRIWELHCSTSVVPQHNSRLHIVLGWILLLIRHAWSKQTVRSLWSSRGWLGQKQLAYRGNPLRLCALLAWHWTCASTSW